MAGLLQRLQSDHPKLRLSETVLHQAVDFLEQLGVDTRVQGHGTVRVQSVAAGRPLPTSVSLTARAR